MNTKIIPNPFDDWTEDKQCFGSFALNKTGSAVESRSLKACKWCASGYLNKKDNISLKLRVEFCLYIQYKFNKSITHLNDHTKLKPQEFKQLWDDFIASRNK